MGRLSGRRSMRCKQCISDQVSLSLAIKRASNWPLPVLARKIETIRNLLETFETVWRCRTNAKQ